MADHVEEKNVGMDRNEIRQAISHVKLVDEEEHERNIENMVQDDDYKSPWKINDAKVATGLNAITYSGDSDEKPAATKEPIKSVGQGQYKPRNQRWFTTKKKNESTVGLDEDGNAGKPVNMARETLVEFRCNRGGRETKEQYRVLGILCK